MGIFQFTVDDTGDAYNYNDDDTVIITITIMMTMIIIIRTTMKMRCSGLYWLESWINAIATLTQLNIIIALLSHYLILLSEYYHCTLILLSYLII